MQRFLAIGLYGLVILTLLFVSCAPAPAPSSVPTATPQVSAPPAPAPVAPAANAQDASWTKIIEAAKKEGVVTIYSASFVGDSASRIARDFQSQYGIKVEILAGSGAIVKERIVVEQAIKQQVADVFNGGGATSRTEITLQGMTEPIAHLLPAVMNDKEAFKLEPVYSPGGEMLAWGISYSGVVVNTKLVKPQDEPRFYNDLLDTRWKGQMLAQDPSTGGSAPFFYVPRFYRVLDLDYYRRLAQQDLKFWAGNTREGIAMVARGEYAMNLVASTETVAPIIAEGAPLKMLNLDEGSVVTTLTIVVLKGAPHPNAAKVFVNWLLTPQGQLAYAESMSGSPLRKDVPDFLSPSARVSPSPKKLWPRTWDFEEWNVKDMAAGSMRKVFSIK